MSLKAYFVRIASTAEVVGLFVASSSMGLAALVDEHCDPAMCEYAAAGQGGLVVASASRAKWPTEASQLAASTGLENAVLTQQWEDDLAVETSDLEWKLLDPAVERLVRRLDKG